MSDYTQITDFSAKDSLTTGDPEKVILGADFDGEFAAIQTAVATKYDSSDIASEAEAEAGVLDTKIITPLQLRNVLQDNAGMAFDISQLADPGADAILVWDDSDGAVESFLVGTGLTSTATAIEVDMLGLEDLAAPGADRVYFYDQTGTAAAFATVTNGLEISGTDLQMASTAAGDGLAYASGVLSVNADQGVKIESDTVRLSDVTAGAAQPVVVTDGTFTFDLSSITTMAITDLDVSQDGVVMSDNGTIKVMPIDEAGVDVIEVSNAAQTFALTDANTMQVLTSIATATKTWTVPTNAAVAFKIGTIILAMDRDGTGAFDLELEGDTGVRLTSWARSDTGTSSTHVVQPGGTAALIKVATDEWAVMGDIT